MSQQLKERLTGAAVLVILGALLIPEFLSGPPADDAVVREELLLPASDAEPVRTHTIRLNDDQHAAARPPVAQAVRNEPDTAPQAAPSTPAVSAGGRPAAQPDAKTADQKTPGPGTRAGGWAVQTGSFAKLENARRLAATLQSMGYDSFISLASIDGNTLHRVRIGPLASRAAADRVAAELQQQGQQAKAVPNP